MPILSWLLSGSSKQMQSRTTRDDYTIIQLMFYEDQLYTQQRAITAVTDETDIHKIEAEIKWLEEEISRMEESLSDSTKESRRYPVVF